MIDLNELRYNFQSTITRKRIIVSNLKPPLLFQFQTHPLDILEQNFIAFLGFRRAIIVFLTWIQLSLTVQLTPFPAVRLAFIRYLVCYVKKTCGDLHPSLRHKKPACFHFLNPHLKVLYARCCYEGIGSVPPKLI